MGDIYRGAELVIIWLGAGSGMAGGPFEQFWRSLKDVTQEEIRLDATARKVGVNFLKNIDWFYRVWIFQEIALARRAQVYCGPFYVQWQTIMHEFGHDIDAIKHLKRIMSSDNPKTLLGLLKATSDRNATDPRDRIYSVLGLYSGSQELTPKYDVSVEQVFVEAAIAVAKEEGLLGFDLLNIDCFQAAYLWDPRSNKKMLHLTRDAFPIPWIPDWSMLKGQDIQNTGRNVFSFSELHSSFQMAISLSETSLVARVVILGHCVRLDKGKIIDWHYKGKGVLQGFPRCIPSATTGKIRSGTFTEDWQFDEGEKPPAYFLGGEIHGKLLNYRNGTCSCPNSDKEGMMKSLKYCIHRWALGSRMADPGPCACEQEVTETETWGWLCLLFGCDFLLVMQPIQDNSSGKLRFCIRHKVPSARSNPHDWHADVVRAQLYVGKQELMFPFKKCSRRQRQQMYRGVYNPYGVGGPRVEKRHLNWILTRFEIIGEMPERDQVHRKEPPCTEGHDVGRTHDQMFERMVQSAQFMQATRR